MTTTTTRPTSPRADTAPVTAPRPHQPAWFRAGIAAAILTGAGAGVMVGALIATPHTPTVDRATFTDTAGRTCTQLTTADAVAIDCDYPPAESRFGGWLDDLAPDN